MKKNMAIAVICLVLASNLTGATEVLKKFSESKAAAPLQIGFGKTTITPRIGSQMWAFGIFKRKGEAIHDSLHVRAMVMNRGEIWGALISVEVTRIPTKRIRQIRLAIREQCGIPLENIILTMTHTHSSPSTRDDESWLTPVNEKIIETVIQAKGSVRPSKIGVGYGFLHGRTINRRWPHRPVDPAVQVMRVEDLNGELSGLVSSFGCHPVVVGPNQKVFSGDYPGVTMTALEEKYGNGAVCLFVNGTAGEVNPYTPRIRAN